MTLVSRPAKAVETVTISQCACSSISENFTRSIRQRLHVAASQDLTELLSVLIADGADIEARNNWGGTPLHAAIFSNSLDAARELLSVSAGIDVVDVSGMTPLHWAAKLNHLPAIELLMKAGAQTFHAGNGDLPIHVAIRQGYVAAVEHFMFHGTDVEAKTSKGDTPLLVAALSNQIEVAEFLFKHSASANTFSRFVPWKKTSGGMIETKESSDRSQPPLTTPLHYACLAGWYEMAAVLLDNHALVNVPNNDGKSPLILAAEADDTNLVYLLIARGAKVNATIPITMKAAAHIASGKGNIETMQKLYQSGVNIHLRCSDGRTAEEYAQRCGNTAKSKALPEWYVQARNLRIMKAREVQRQNQQSTTPSLGVQNRSVGPPPQQNEFALIQQLSPPGDYYDPCNDSFPEAPWCDDKAGLRDKWSLYHYSRHNT